MNDTKNENGLSENQNADEKPLTGLERRMQNLKPFKSYEESTEEERERMREIVTKGAYVRTEKQRAKKNLKETALSLLETELSREQAKKLIGDKADLIPDDNLTMQAVLTVRLATALVEDGNAKAFEVLRDTSGQTVKQQVELDANLTMTDADRALMDKINARLSKNE